MITYNHEQFIAKAIESVMMQVTDFDYELVIGEDCSTDGTRSIVADYQKRYPDKIRALLREKNLGMYENGMQTLVACQGQYIALLEGDDYWIDPCKLQKQVVFLDRHPDYALCFANVMVVYEKEGMQSHPAYGNMGIPEHDGYITVMCRPAETTTIYDLARGNYIHTPGVLFRNCFLAFGLPDYIKQSRQIIDWSIHMFTALHGKIRYFDEIMSVYRSSVHGAWSMQSYISKQCIIHMQHCAMLRSGVFNEQIKDIWRRQLPVSFFDLYHLAVGQQQIQQVVEVAKALDGSWNEFECELAREYWMVHDKCESLAKELRWIKSRKSYRLLKTIYAGWRRHFSHAKIPRVNPL